jgi:hypothetical protein
MSPSILVWATDARSAMNIARQTGANITGAREIVPWSAFESTFLRVRRPEALDIVIHGGGEGFYHRHRGKTYRMDEHGTFRTCSHHKP